MPWKVLGQKWHLARKGFAPGKRVAWPPELLEELLEMLGEVRLVRDRRGIGNRIERAGRKRIVGMDRHDMTAPGETSDPVPAVVGMVTKCGTSLVT